MSQPERPPAPPKLPGVIDTLSTGYQMLNKHPYLLLVPVILDFFYWLGPRLSVQPLAQRAATAIQDMAVLAATDAAGTQSVQSLDMVRTTVESMGQSMNLFSLLSGALSVPTLLSSQDLQTPAWLGEALLHTVGAFGELAVLVVLLFVAGVAAGAIYMGSAARTVGEGHGAPAAFLRKVAMAAVSYLQVVLIMLVAGVIIGLPASLAVGILTLVSPTIGSILLLVVWSVLFWAYVHLFFTVQAIFISDAGPLHAIRNSITVVRLSTSSALRLLVLMFILSWGMSYVWSMLGTSDIAIVAGILGNAYIGTGMMLAGMIFYRDRMQAIQSAQRVA